MTNESAIGYAILALKKLGYRDEEIRKIESEIRYQMDMKTKEEAQEQYRQF